MNESKILRDRVETESTALRRHAQSVAGVPCHHRVNGIKIGMNQKVYGTM